MQDPSVTPYQLPGVRVYNTAVTTELEAIIQRTMQLRPEARFQTTQELRQALQGSQVVVPPPPQSRQISTLWLIISLLLFIVLAGGVGMLIYNNMTLPLPVLESSATPSSQIVVIDVVSTETAAPTTIDTKATDIPDNSPATEANTSEIVEGAAEPIEPPIVESPVLEPQTDTSVSVPQPADTLPDSNRPIVFDSTRNEPQAEIYIMNSDGTNQQRLTINTVQDDDADLSPDGQWIAFDRGSNRTETIWLMRRDGSEARSLVDGRAPDWSPDGRYLAYETLGDSPHIQIIELSNGTSWALTSGSRAYRAPDWSPDMSKIVAMSHFGNDWQIVILDVATGTEQQITFGSDDKRFPSWSPDGSLIAYNTLDSRGWPDDIWLIEPSGAGGRAVTSGGNNGRPTWSPDSQYLVFNRLFNDDWVLYKVDINGQQGTFLTTGAHDQRASWSN